VGGGLEICGVERFEDWRARGEPVVTPRRGGRPSNLNAARRTGAHRVHRAQARFAGGDHVLAFQALSPSSSGVFSPSSKRSSRNCQA